MVFFSNLQNWALRLMSKGTESDRIISLVLSILILFKYCSSLSSQMLDLAIFVFYCHNQSYHIHPTVLEPSIYVTSWHTVLRSFIWRRKVVVPNSLPWATPALRWLHFKVSIPTLTHCFLSHEWGHHFSRKRVLANFVRMILWSTLSKACLKSSSKILTQLQ